MDINRIRVLSKKGIYIIKKEGLYSFIKQVLIFFKRFFIYYGNFYIYENDLKSIPQLEKQPENFNLKIISKPEQVIQLSSEGFDLDSFGAVSLDAEEVKRNVSQEKILFCVFSGKEIAHATWVALSKEAKKDIDILPYTIDFKNEACIGHHVTNPKYRRQGHLTYTTYQIHKFFIKKGFSRARFSVPTNIIAVQKSEAKLGSKILTKGRYLKILWWEFWKEEPVKELKEDDSRVRTIT